MHNINLNQYFNSVLGLTFVGPCIVIYFYSKTNQMNNIWNLFYFGTTLYMFRTVFPSIIRSLRLYIQHHTIQVLWLFASGNEMEHLVTASKQPAEPVWHIPDAVCTVSDSWWWTERPSETCIVLLQNKMNVRYCASGWFYYRNILLSTVLQTSYLKMSVCSQKSVAVRYISYQIQPWYCVWKHSSCVNVISNL